MTGAACRAADFTLSRSHSLESQATMLTEDKRPAPPPAPAETHEAPRRPRPWSFVELERKPRLGSSSTIHGSD
jgi:hypothetical protein